MVVEGNPDTKKRFKGFHTLEQHLNDLWGLLKYRWMVWEGRPPVFDAVGLSRGGISQRYHTQEQSLRSSGLVQTLFLFSLR